MEIIQPLIANMLSQLEQVIVRMYTTTEDQKQLRKAAADPKSPLLSELIAKIKWIKKELFGRMNCGADLREWITRVRNMVLNALVYGKIISNFHESCFTYSTYK